MIRIVQLLDGTPAVYGKRQSGQSVVELALITPILIVLLAGLVEIGWFANNYLSLLDVTRSGARRGAVLQDQKSPLFWDNKYSYVPTSLLTGFDDWMMPENPASGTNDDRFRFRWYPNRTPAGSRGDACLDYDPLQPTVQFVRAFYNEVTCTMIASMDPLVLNPENGIDDIVVSGFALQAVDPSVHNNWLAAYPLRPLDPAVYGQVPQVVVAGRYPSNANECDVTASALDGSPVLVPRELRDPFDFNNNNMRDIQPVGTVIIDGTNDFTELEGYDATAASEADREKQVGFSLFGNHKIADTYCVGSEWTMRNVEDLVNLPNYDLTTGVERGYLPSQGLILVEMYWEHEMLLKIPVLSPVFTAVGNQDGRMVINVWAAFPLAAAEPHILFP